MQDLTYRSPKTEVRGSPIHGRGLFAKAPISEGEIVAVKGGHIVTGTRWLELQPVLGSSEIQVAEDLFITPVTLDQRHGAMLYTNHSCEPNIGIQGQIVFVAMRDIAAGEELTHDWATADDLDYRMECKCGAPGCRGVITGKDWMRPELQEKYRGWFCWFLQRKINRLVQLCLLILLFTATVTGTELRLRFKDQSGRPVNLSKAELLLVSWGTVGRIALDADGDSLLVPLDEDWLATRWPNRFNDLEKVYLYLQAGGFAAIRSDPFLWLGTHKPPMGGGVEEIKISFPGGGSLSAKPGDMVALEVVFRRPDKRTLRLTADGVPVPGVEVASSMFWSDSNHCGALAGKEPLGVAVSDALGRLPVVDGDFEYVLEIKTPDYFFESPRVSSYPRRLVTRWPGSELTLELHRLEVRPLELRVTSLGRPVVDRALIGCVSACPCGACCGTLATSDAEGRIYLAGFQPDKWRELRFPAEDESAPDLWRWDPLGFGGGTVQVELAPSGR